MGIELRKLMGAKNYVHKADVRFIPIKVRLKRLMTRYDVLVPFHHPPMDTALKRL